MVEGPNFAEELGRILAKAERTFKNYPSTELPAHVAAQMRTAISELPAGELRQDIGRIVGEDPSIPITAGQLAAVTILTAKEVSTLGETVELQGEAIKELYQKFRQTSSVVSRIGELAVTTGAAVGVASPFAAAIVGENIGKEMLKSGIETSLTGGCLLLIQSGANFVRHVRAKSRGK
jgi:hypothetical protein